MKKISGVFLATLLILGLAANVHAVPVSIDLSGAVTGTSIIAPGGSFASTFVGQTVAVDGFGIVGSPTGLLTLAPSQTLTVAAWGTNSILPNVPSNQGPLSILLDGYADAISWRMGNVDDSGDAFPLFAIDLFSMSGALVATINPTLSAQYADYNISGYGVFAGLTFYNNNDPAGMRYQNFSYNSVSVPEPSTLLLLGGGLIGLAGFRRKFKV